MTLSDLAQDVRARTHIGEDATADRATSQNGHGRAHLRVVPDQTHIPAPPQTSPADHSASDHLTEAFQAAGDHPVAATLPPTVAEAIENLWLDRDEARHGVLAQIAAAGIGLIQAVGLSVCWAIAHVFFASKTRTALFLLTAAAALTVWAVASHV